MERNDNGVEQIYAAIERSQGTRAITASSVFIGIALGCNLSWVLMFFQSMGLFAGFENSESLLDSTYLISIVSVSITLVCVGVFHRQAKRLLGSGIAHFLIPVLVCGSTLLALGIGLPGMGGLAMMVLCGICTGVTSGLFLMYFGVVLSLLSTRQTVAVTAIGFALSSLLFFVFLFLQPLAATLFCASMPLIAGFILSYGIKTLSLPAKSELDPLPAQELPGDPAERNELKSLTISFTACTLLVGLVNEASRTIYVQAGSFAALDATSYAITQGGVALVVTVGAIALALALVTSRGIKGPEWCYRICIIFLVISVLLLATIFVYPEIPVYLAYAVNVASFQCFSMMMWVLICGLCHRYAQTCIRTFAFIRAGWAIGPCLGILLGRALSSNGLDIQEILPMMIGLVVVLLIVSGFIFTEKELVRALNILPIERRHRFQDKCQAVIERYGLSEREGEIMTLFAKGRNLAHIQEELNVSKSTVSTHRQHIYQKLDVHSAQEMIDLIQSTDAKR